MGRYTPRKKEDKPHIPSRTRFNISAATDNAGEMSVSGGADVAAVPLDLPLGESDLVGSVMYRRSGEF